MVIGIFLVISSRLSLYLNKLLSNNLLLNKYGLSRNQRTNWLVLLNGEIIKILGRWIRSTNGWLFGLSYVIDADYVIRNDWSSIMKKYTVGSISRNFL